MNTYHSDIQIKKEIIKKAICHYAALIDSKYLPEPFFNVLSKFINPNFIDDKSLLSNERIKNHIDWDKLDKLKLLRLIVRDKYILERLDLNKHDFTLRDLIPVFIMHPDLIDYFEIDFNTLSGIDAINLLKINTVFIEKIDLGKYKYSKNEIVQILESFHGCPKIIENLNIENLDHYAIRTLVIKSGEKYLEKLDLKKIKALDWLEILKKRPDFIKYCDLDLFQTGDCFLLTKLVQIVPDLSYLIEENKEKISALGWEELLVFDQEKYSKHCNFDCLSKKNWVNITNYHPGMINLMNRYIL
jgi:hypothetical protein